MDQKKAVNVGVYVALLIIGIVFTLFMLLFTFVADFDAAMASDYSGMILPVSILVMSIVFNIYCVVRIISNSSGPR